MLLHWMKSKKWLRQLGMLLIFPFMLVFLVIVYLVFDPTVFHGCSWRAELQGFKDGRLGS